MTQHLSEESSKHLYYSRIYRERDEINDGEKTRTTEAKGGGENQWHKGDDWSLVQDARRKRATFKVCKPDNFAFYLIQITNLDRWITQFHDLLFTAAFGNCMCLITAFPFYLSCCNWFFNLVNFIFKIGVKIRSLFFSLHQTVTKN